MCIRYPCNIDNCNLCFRSNVCQVCAPGYTLNNQTNQCQAYTVQGSNCPTNCISCGSNGCQQCLNGYRLYQGLCVCNFQNCLECLGGEFCTKCADSLMPTFVANDGGCVPNVKVDMQCNVDNCLQCYGQNQCGLCYPGFNLNSAGMCVQNDCPEMQNCELCSISQNLCFLCQPGFIQPMLFSPVCEPLSGDYSCNVMGCSICESSTACQMCQETYSLNPDKTCSPASCTQNCMVCFHGNACIACSMGYYLNTDYTCQMMPTNSSNP